MEGVKLMPISVAPKAVSLSTSPNAVGVFRLSGGKLSLLPNIRFLQCKEMEGPNPSQATFRYVFDATGAIDVNHAWPYTPEQVIGNPTPGPYVVSADDRLCVYTLNQAGDTYLLFDGFVRQPAMTISTAHARNGVSLMAQGTPIRCWDRPMFQRLQRGADLPTTTGNDHLVDLPMVFNPKGRANCTPIGSDGMTGGQMHPVFLDDLILEDYNDDPTKGRNWDVPAMVKYVLAQGNDQAYVKNPPFGPLDALLNARVPSNGQYLDNSNAGSYTAQALTARELDGKGYCWPDLLEMALRRIGFTFRFDLTQDSNALPVWSIVFIREADTSTSNTKTVMLQPLGSNLDTTKTNVTDMHIVQDSVDSANQYVCETGLYEVEASFVLAPLAGVDPADATNISKFDLDGPNFAGNQDRYRLYGFDECAEGHWNFASNGFLYSAATLAPLIGGPNNDENAYVKRRRPGVNQLFTRDPNDQFMKSLLLISWDYKGKYPAIWDGTGTWYPVSHTWRLCDDLLGIYITAKNPESWNVGTKDVNFGVNLKSNGGTVKGVSAQCVAGETRFFLMLHTVIRGDTIGQAVASKRDASPSRFTIQRVIDARERYKQQYIAKNSWYNKNNPAITFRDDTKQALYDATARRAANEMPKTAGPILIRKHVFNYNLGDRISAVAGRNISLRTNGGQAGGEGPIYPRVVAIEYKADTEQSTTLYLEDDRGNGRIG